jgi:hypothetical protein
MTALSRRRFVQGVGAVGLAVAAGCGLLALRPREAAHELRLAQ